MGAKADEFFNFMINSPQDVYAKWLPEEHYEFYLISKGENEPMGNYFYFDQNINLKHRMKFHATIITVKRPTKIVFQMRKLGVNLPGFLDLEFEDTSSGLALTEQIRIGFKGIGKVFDPFIKIVYSKTFFRNMDTHHKKEWEDLARCLKEDSNH